MKNIGKIILSKKSVFTYQDIKNILGIDNINTIKSYFARGVKAGIFKNIFKGVYVLNNYSQLELANKLKQNSYISFETVLKSEGIIFQDYGNTIFLATDQSIEKNIGETNFKYLKLKNSILLNPIGIINMGNYMIASKERAICDRLYLSKNYYFDNVENVDFEKLEIISQIYNKRVILDIKKLIKNAKHGQT